MHRALATIFATSLALSPLAALAEDTAPDWLFVQTSSGFTLDGTRLTLPFEREVFAFTDRPNRMHGYLNAHELEGLWQMGGDDFAKNPPNAVLTWLADSEIREAEIELMAVSAGDHGRAITYEITVEAGTEIPSSAAYVSLFIDSAPVDAPNPDAPSILDIAAQAWKTITPAAYVYCSAQPKESFDECMKGF